MKKPQIIIKILAWVIIDFVLMSIFMAYNLENYDSPRFGAFQLILFFLIPWFFLFSKWSEDNLWSSRLKGEQSTDSVEKKVDYQDFKNAFESISNPDYLENKDKSDSNFTEEKSKINNNNEKTDAQWIFGGIFFAFIVILIINSNSQESNSKNLKSPTSSPSSIKQNSTYSIQNPNPTTSLKSNQPTPKKSNPISSNDKTPKEAIKTNPYNYVEFKTGDNPYYEYFGHGEFYWKNQFYLVINAPLNEDIVFNLIEFPSNKIARSVYIKKNESYTIEFIYPGVYDYSIIQGNSWASNLVLNKRITGGFTKDLFISKNKFNKDQIIFKLEYEGGYSINLKSIRGGNLGLTNQSKENFLN